VRVNLENAVAAADSAGPGHRRDDAGGWIWTVFVALLVATVPLPGAAQMAGVFVQDAGGLRADPGWHGPGRQPWEVRLLNAVAARSGIALHLLPATGRDPVAALRDGSAAFAVPLVAEPGALPLQSRTFGTRRDILVVPLGYRGPTEPAAALAAIHAARLRVAVSAQSPLAASIAMAPGGRVVISDVLAMRTLLDGEADAAVVEVVTGLQMLGPEGGRRFVPIVAPLAVSPVVIGFAAGALDAPTLARLDQAIEALSNEALAWREAELRTALLRHALATAPWFGWLELIGLVAFAFSGVLIARAEGWSLFGGMVLAVLPALGGGVVRDLLAGRRPLFVMEAPEPLLIVGTVVLLSFATLRLLDHGRGRWIWLIDVANFYVWMRGRVRPLSLLEVTDAAGLAAFTVTGVLTAVRFGVEPLWLWGPIMAVLTGAGGGILRDIVRSDPTIPVLRRSFYAEICFIWGLFLSLGLLWFTEDLSLGSATLLVATTVLGAFVMRLAAWRCGWLAPSFAPLRN
jgi:polar amino acid transport system substrate-binding protein